MSSFEEYRNEVWFCSSNNWHQSKHFPYALSWQVLSGQLEWSPVHRQDKFWRDNAARLNEDSYKLVKVLIELLDNATDSTVRLLDFVIVENKNKQK